MKMANSIINFSQNVKPKNITFLLFFFFFQSKIQNL